MSTEVEKVIHSECLHSGQNTSLEVNLKKFLLLISAPQCVSFFYKSHYTPKVKYFTLSQHLEKHVLISHLAICLPLSLSSVSMIPPLITE